MENDYLKIILTVILIAILAVGAYVSYNYYEKNQLPEGWEIQSFDGFTLAVPIGSSFLMVDATEDMGFPSTLWYSANPTFSVGLTTSPMTNLKYLTFVNSIETDYGNANIYYDPSSNIYTGNLQVNNKSFCVMAFSQEYVEIAYKGFSIEE